MKGKEREKERGEAEERRKEIKNLIIREDVCWFLNRRFPFFIKFIKFQSDCFISLEACARVARVVSVSAQDQERQGGRDETRGLE